MTLDISFIGLKEVSGVPPGLAGGCFPSSVEALPLEPGTVCFWAGY